LEGPALLTGMPKNNDTGDSVTPEPHCATPIGCGRLPGDEVVAASAAINFLVTIHIFFLYCTVVVDKNINGYHMPYYHEGPDDKFSSNFL
jgi:hypothetical protein